MMSPNPASPLAAISGTYAYTDRRGTDTGALQHFCHMALRGGHRGCRSPAAVRADEAISWGTRQAPRQCRDGIAPAGVTQLGDARPGRPAQAGDRCGGQNKMGADIAVGAHCALVLMPCR